MKVGIVGLGLIGGSIGLALRKPERTVLGYDPVAAAGQVALGRQCVDKLVSLEEVSQCDAVFVASPPAAVPGNLDQLWATAPDTTVITDCASTKGEIVNWAKATKASRFVPGHPMAGHEKTGAAYSSSWLFRHARWILCPLSLTSRDSIRVVETLVKEMGATPLRMNAESHDEQVAILSHVPHILAAALVRAGRKLENADIAGASWRDLTRVGGVDPDLWTQILMSNRAQIVGSLDEFGADLQRFRQALDAGDEDALRDLMRDAVIAKHRLEPPPKPRPIAGAKRSRK